MTLRKVACCCRVRFFQSRSKRGSVSKDLLLFTYVFGGAIAHGSAHTYLQYELPGLLVMTVVFATLGTGLMLNQDISSGVFDRFRSLPIAAGRRWRAPSSAIWCATSSRSQSPSASG